MIWRLLKILLNPLIRNFYNLQVRVGGRDNIPDSGAIIILGNQANYISTLAAETVLKRKIYWAVAPSVCKSKMVRFFLKVFCGCFVLQTERADIRGFRSAFRVLKKLNILAFYPGGINQGIALFCLRSGYNILPMSITQEALNPRCINIAFGPVYNLSDYQDIIVNMENIKDLIQKINQSIEKSRQ